MNQALHTLLLDIARASIAEKFGISAPIDRETLIDKHPELNQDRATFITLTQQGQLRGCIGSLLPQRTLIEDVHHNAKAAAFSDPRFSPLMQEELVQTRIEISVLSIPEELPYTDADDLKSKIRPMIDGVILKKGIYQATFLPQVWEQLPDFETFFGHLCMKAGMKTACLGEHPQIFIYQAEKFKEAES